MAGLFAQMWLLELTAFLLGAAVTWLGFVRPARAAAARAAQAAPRRAEPHVPPSAAAVPGPPTVAADPALAALDAHSRHARRSGFAAADALEQMNSTSPAPTADARER